MTVGVKVSKLATAVLVLKKIGSLSVCFFFRRFDFVDPLVSSGLQVKSHHLGCLTLNATRNFAGNGKKNLVHSGLSVSQPQL
ncbi:MAG: hypothetical protein SGI77_10315 [Pirellulaceae bacterium]|nr:hypothetical protein [Pirellulaceae bacterium]